MPIQFLGNFYRMVEVTIGVGYFCTASFVPCGHQVITVQLDPTLTCKYIFTSYMVLPITKLITKVALSYRGITHATNKFPKKKKKLSQLLLTSLVCNHAIKVSI